MSEVSRAEYWLLDLVKSCAYALSILVDEELEIATNRRGHGLSRVELVDTLEKLFQRGDIIANWKVVLGREEIEAALNHPFGPVYSLTEQGGARWEALSKPNWKRYLDVSYGCDPDEGKIISMNEPLAERQLEMEYALGNIVIPGSIRRHRLIPWQATYWKTVPMGYRITFRYVPRTEPISSQYAGTIKEEHLQASKWLQEGQRWYDNYLERE